MLPHCRCLPYDSPAACSQRRQVQHTSVPRDIVNYHGSMLVRSEQQSLSTSRCSVLCIRHSAKSVPAQDVKHNAAGYHQDIAALFEGPSSEVCIGTYLIAV
jgi:hypothetical protein